ncbi:unnamed protein product, partial [Closterium sp. NIES-64]
PGPSPTLALPIPLASVHSPSPTLALPIPLASVHSPSPTLALPIPHASVHSPSPTLALPIPLASVHSPSPTLALPIPLARVHSPSPTLALPIPLASVHSPSPTLALPIPLASVHSPSPTLALPIPLASVHSPSPTLALPIPLASVHSPSPTLALPIPLASVHSPSPTLALPIPLASVHSPSPTLALPIPLASVHSPSPTLALPIPLASVHSPSPTLALPIPLASVHSPSPTLGLPIPLASVHSPSPTLALPIPLASVRFLSSPPGQGGPIFPLLLSPIVTLSQSLSHPTAPLHHHPFPSLFSLPPFAGQSPFPTPTLIRGESHFPSPPLTPCDTVPIPLSSFPPLHHHPFPMFFSLPPYAGQSPFPTPTLIRWRSHLPSPPLTPCDTVPIPLSSYISLAPPSLSLFLLPTSLRRAGGPIFPLLLSPVVTLSQSRSHPTAPLNHHPFPSFFSLPPIAAQSPFPTPTLIRWRSHFPSPPLTPCDTGSPLSLLLRSSVVPPSQSRSHPFLPTSPVSFPLSSPYLPEWAVPFPYSQWGITLCLCLNPALILFPLALLLYSPFPLLSSIAGQSPFPTPTLIRCASVPIPLSSFPPFSLPMSPGALDAAVFVLEEDMLPIPEEDEGEEVEENDAEALDDQIQPSSTPARVGATQDEARVHGLDEAEHVAVTEEHAEVPVGAPQDEGDTVGVGGADSTAGEAVHEESSPARVDTSQDEACVHGLDEAAHVAVPEKHAAVPVGAPHDDRDTVGVGGANSTAGEAVHEESTPARVDAAQRTDGSPV